MDLALSRIEVEAELYRRSLPDFIRAAWPLVVPDRDLSWNWHHGVLCDVLQAVSRGEIKRLIVNIPPGSSKSVFVSTLWPTWEWASNASLRVLTAAYSADNTTRDNRLVRAIVTSDWYRERFGLELASDQSAKVRFDTTAKGWRIATGVGGLGTGEHPDRIIIDDPHKAKDARSPVKLAEARSWFDGTIATRKQRDPAFVIVMQRLHVEDLTGHLLEKGGWHHLMLPMRFDPERADPRDPRTEPGELLWPEIYDEESVREEELDLGAFGVAGQLQQNPVPEGGGLFRREWFQFVDAAPVEARRCRGWDTAATENAGDWTAGVKVAEAGGIWWVEDVKREQVGPFGQDALIEQCAELDGPGCIVREEQEPGSSGKKVVAIRARRLAGYDYAAEPVDRDKVTRANPFRAQCEAGNVRIVRGPWNAAYLDELCSFPVGRNDDQVDGTSCAFNALALAPKRKRYGTWRTK